MDSFGFNAIRPPSGLRRWTWRQWWLSRPFPITIDVVRLGAGGQNGGIKPYLLSLFGAAQQACPRLRLYWICSTGMAAELVPWLATDDRVLVVRESDGISASGLPADRRIAWRPDLEGKTLRRMGARLLYAGFAASDFAPDGPPLVSLVVDTLHRDLPAMLPPEEVAHRETVFRRTLPQARAVHCLTGFVAGQVQRHFGVPREKTFFIAPTPPRRKIEAPASQAETRPFFFYPANFWPHKNHATLLAAYALYVRDAGPAAWDLVLTGHADARMTQLQATARATGIGDRVQFRGHVADAEFSQLWHTAGALVFPSLYEGLGQPLLEAMQYGLPILTGSHAAIPETVGDAAVLVDMHDPSALARAMGELSRSPEKCRTLAALGRSRLAGLSAIADAQAARWVAILKEVALG